MYVEYCVVICGIVAVYAVCVYDVTVSYRVVTADAVVAIVVCRVAVHGAVRCGVCCIVADCVGMCCCAAGRSVGNGVC